MSHSKRKGDAFESNLVGLDVVESSSFTRNKYVQYKHSWGIDNFRKFESDLNKPLFSSFFPTNDKYGIQWKMLIEKKGENGGASSYSLYLYYSGKKSQVTASGSLFLINQAGERVNELHLRTHTYFAGKDTSWGFLTFISHDRLFSLKNLISPGNQLTIGCEINVFLDSVNVDKVAYVSKKERSTSSMKKDFERLLQNSGQSDVVIKIGRRKFPAHKLVLSTRSKVFAAMFEHDTIEKQQKCAIIQDVDADVMQEFLHYIYTDEAPKLKELAYQLMVVADKYDVESLKILAEEELGNNLSARNVISVLMLSDLQCNEQLKEAALKFTVANFQDVPKDTDWVELKSKHPNLVDSILSKMSEKQCDFDVVKQPELKKRRVMHHASEEEYSTSFSVTEEESIDSFSDSSSNSDHSDEHSSDIPFDQDDD